MTDTATVKGPIGRSSNASRQRILAAAALRFSQHSYEETTLRDIAADVSVDVALVHRAFGSKEELFKQAVRLTINDDVHRATRANEPALALSKLLVLPRRASERDQIDTLDLFVRSLNSAPAMPVLRELVQHDFIEPMASRKGANGEIGAAMAMACLTGVALLRDVLGVTALRNVDDEVMERMAAHVMQACFEPNLPIDSRSLQVERAKAPEPPLKGQQ